jgi:hypothetical protein
VRLLPLRRRSVTPHVDAHRRAQTQQPLVDDRFRHHLYGTTATSLLTTTASSHTDRRERFTRQGRNRDCDARMSRDSGKGEHRAVVFIGSAQEVTGGESAQRDDYDGAEGAFAGPLPPCDALNRDPP